MRWYTYDTEVFAHDWIVVFKSKSGVYSVFHNDNDGVRDFVIDEANIFCGFNTKGYDQYIIKAICGGLSPEEIKQVNDWIISSVPAAVYFAVMTLCGQSQWLPIPGLLLGGVGSLLS